MHQPSCGAPVAVPQLVADFGEKLALIAQHATDRAAALKLGTAKKGARQLSPPPPPPPWSDAPASPAGLANEYKRSVGQLVEHGLNPV